MPINFRDGQCVEKLSQVKYMPIPAGYVKDSPDRTLKNGATAAYFLKPDGTRVFRIYKSSAAIAAGATAARRTGGRRKITKDQAQAAFDSHYSRTRKLRRGPNKGKKPRYASPTGRRAARTYDEGHTTAPDLVVDDTRYLNSPWRYDFQGVDTGKKVRKPQTAAQKAALAKGRKALAAKRAAQKGGQRGQQNGGFWW